MLCADGQCNYYGKCGAFGPYLRCHLASAETDSSSCSLFECKCSPDEWDIRCMAWLYEETHGMLKWRRFVKVAKVKVPDMS